jgi:hypothetical protein
MLTKQSQYFFDLDPLREPLSHPAMSPNRPRPISDGSSGLPYFSNPMGRVGGSVWYIPPFDYRGKHPATFPPQLVRRILAASCDNDAVVLDPGGAGTVALVLRGTSSDTSTATLTIPRKLVNASPMRRRL